MSEAQPASTPSPDVAPTENPPRPKVLGFPVAAVGAMPSELRPVAELLGKSMVGRGLSIILVPYTPPASRGNPVLELTGSRKLVEARPDVALEPDCTYVVRHDRPVVLDGGRFISAGKARRASTSPLSAMLSSLAEALGPRGVGVVLSGTSNREIEGLRALKAAGGVVMVQEPGLAAFDEAPRAAIASGLADQVLSLPRIAEELARLFTAPLARVGTTVSESAGELENLDHAEEEIPDEAFRRILSLLKTRFHVDLGHYKLTTIRRRVERRMNLSRFDQLAEYADHLRTSPDALKELHDDLFIHVTQFFRNPESFQALRESVFPSLLKGRNPEDPIRVWVPGCSTGEEAYSLGIALTEFLEEHGAPTKLQIFATDISDAAIQYARKGVYPQALLAEVGEQRAERFFERVKEGFKVRKELRDPCIISRHDVTSNPPFAKLDLISCRNVLIYFGPDLQKRVIPIFHYALKPTGYLWLGHSETPGASSKLFSLVDKQNKIYAKIPSAPAYLQLTSSRFTTEPLELPRGFGRETKSEQDFLKSADQLVLYKYAPPGVVINHELEILQFRGKTAPFLEPPAGQPTHSLLKMAHPDLLSTLRPLVQLAKKQNRPVRQEQVALEEGGARRVVNLEVAPLNPMSPDRERQYLVLFEEPAARGKTPAPAQAGPARHRPARRRATADSKDQYIEHLQQEVDALREYQQTLVEQFESSQEELTSANEELQATNEEFQSTNEELETAKEELQSANEELTTMNDELQSRNAELVAVNEKLARGEDRFRLMVEGVKDYAIYMLDPDGRVTSWNEGARRLTGYEASEILGEYYGCFFSAEDVAAQRPQRELERARIEGRYEESGWRIRKDGSRYWANVVVTRIHDSGGTLIGFSKVTRDLTERKRAEQELAKSERQFRLMVSQVRDYAIFTLDPAGRIASWNEGARQLKGYEESEILGKHFSIFYPAEDLAAGKVEREMATAMETGRVEDEGWRLRKDGSRFWANVVITRVNDSDGNLVGFTKVTRDLSERKRAHEALQAANEGLEAKVRERTQELAQALMVRDEFLSIASHELRTPLTGLKLQLQLALRSLHTGHSKYLSPDEAAGTFARALKQANALEELVEDLLDIPRLQTGRFQLELADLEVRTLVEDVAARFSNQLAQVHSTLELELERDLVARWDQRRVTQVLANLMSNAIKYAPASPIRISASREGGKARILFEDSGPGISKANQAVIFERFERAGASPNVGGLGLGLFISRRIIEAHQGTIRVEGDVGEGARFVIELPLRPSESELQADLGAGQA